MGNFGTTLGGGAERIFEKSKTFELDDEKLISDTRYRDAFAVKIADPTEFFGPKTVSRTVAHL